MAGKEAPAHIPRSGKMTGRSVNNDFPRVLTAWFLKARYRDTGIADLIQF
jgi:hypothetical protein